MRIKMAGIEHQRAPLKIRELFSLTQSGLEKALKSAVEIKGITGCVIINTCNRTELWISGEDEVFDALHPAEVLAGLKNQDYQEYECFFATREGEEAVHYLMQLCCGLQSQIFGDDQIISQVKRALEIAREVQVTDSVLETLFRTAVTGAKKVKSTIVISHMDSSVAGAMISLLKKNQIEIEGKHCLVIGNGEIGRLAASELVKAGGDVSMTLRQYKRRDAVIPAGCKVVPYESRYEQFINMDIIVSATVSPHFTLEYELLKERLDGRPRVIVDLAIPRDIEEGIGDQEGITLYDMDSFSQLKSEADLRAIEETNAILLKYEAEFAQYYDFRDYVPIVKRIAKSAGIETGARLHKELRGYVDDADDREELESAIARTTAKVVAKLCYGLRDGMETEEWSVCLRALKEAADHMMEEHEN